MFIVILPFTLIHGVSLLVSILVPLISDTKLSISFLIRKPTPPPFPVSLFIPIHLYPCMLMFSLEVSWVSVIAAMCVPCWWSAVVRLMHLLFIPLVLMVSSFRFSMVLVVFFLFPLRVWWFSCAFGFRVLWISKYGAKVTRFHAGLFLLTFSCWFLILMLVVNVSWSIWRGPELNGFSLAVQG